MDKAFEEKCLRKRAITLEPTVSKIKDERPKDLIIIFNIDDKYLKLKVRLH